MGKSLSAQMSQRSWFEVIDIHHDHRRVKATTDIPTSAFGPGWERLAVYLLTGISKNSTCMHAMSEARVVAFNTARPDDLTHFPLCERRNVVRRTRTAVRALIDAPGQEAYQALLDLSKKPHMKSDSVWLAESARRKAREDADSQSREARHRLHRYAANNRISGGTHRGAQVRCDARSPHR